VTILYDKRDSEWNANINIPRLLGI